MTKRIISFLLALCLIVLTIGCSNKNDTSSEITEEEKPVELGNAILQKNAMSGAYINDPLYKESNQIRFFENDILQYNIVYADSLTKELKAVVKKELFAGARKINGKRANYFSDAEEYQNNLKNILIGDTKEALSNEAKTIVESQSPNYYDFVIMVKDGNIAINAVSEESLQAAVEFFNFELFTNINATIPEDYLFHYSPKIDTNFKINGIDISKFAIETELYPAGMVYFGCQEIQSAIKEIAGIEIPIISGQNHNYKNCIIVKTDGERADYTVEVREDNLVVTGGTDYAINAALHNLAMNIGQTDKKQNVNIPSDYRISGKYDESTYNTDGYRLIWNEEFDTPLDETIWIMEDYYNTNYKKYVTPDIISYKDSNMIYTMELVPEPDGSVSGQGANIHSSKGLLFNYGYYEIRCKMPKGNGFWPTFWNVGRNKNNSENGNLEIDVFELFGSDKTVVTQLHTWFLSGKKIKGMLASDGQVRAGHIAHQSDLAPADMSDPFSGGSRFTPQNVENLSDDYHTYGVEWTPSYIKFYFDGANYMALDLESKLTHPIYGYRIAEYLTATNGTLVDMAIGCDIGTQATFIAPVDGTTQIPGKFYVDYVRLYQLDNLGTLWYKGEYVKGGPDSEK